MAANLPAPFSSQRQLVRAQQAVLKHVRRYGLTVTGAVQQLKPFKTLTERETRRVLTTLEDEGALKAVPLFAGKCCHVLAAHSADHGEERHASRRSHKPLSEETKLRRYAMLSLCCLSSVARHRLTRQEVIAAIDGGDARNCSDSYYQSGDRLGFLRVDMTGRGRWDRILARCQTDAWRHARSELWRPLIDADRFEITVVSALPQKADRLCRAIGELAMPPPVALRVAAIPDLLYIIAPPRDC